jgi:predicted dienelactone hydrolase
LLGCDDVDEIPSTDATDGDAFDSETTDPGHPFDQETSVESLEGYGTFAVGHDESTVSYTPPGETEPRELPVRVWYPAPSDASGEDADYAVGGIVELDPLVADEAIEVSGEGPFPLAVYSHGSGGDNLLPYPYAEQLASRGWVVVSANHVGNTALDSLGGSELPFEEIAVKRVTDVSALIDAASDGFGLASLAGNVEDDNVFLFGHSFGAYTTLVAGGGTLDLSLLQATCDDRGGEECAYLDNEDVAAAIEDGLGDERIVAIAPQAPAVASAFAEGGYAAINIPTLLMSGELDQTTPEDTQTLPVWDGLDEAEDVWLDIPTGAHFTFITICDDLSPGLLASFQPDAPDDGCGEEFIPTTEAIPVLRTYVTAFAELHALGVDAWADLFVGSPIDERFELSRHTEE